MAVFKPVASTSKTILDITDSYTVVLTNESVSIVANANGTSPVLPVSTDVVAYRGTTPLTATNLVPTNGKFRIESISMTPTTGFSSTITNDKTVNITAIGTAGLNSGFITIAINVENKATINKVFTWTKSLKGTDGLIGSDAYTVVLSNETYSISCNADGSVKTGEIGPTGKAISDIIVYKGTTRLTATNIATPGAGTFKYVLGTPVNCTAVRTDDDTFYINNVTADSGSVPLTIYCEGTTIAINKIFSWTKLKDAAGLDWINTWNGTKTDIGGTQILTPKIFAGSGDANTYTGIAIGKDIFGTGTNFTGIAGYVNKVKTFHIKADGTAEFGAVPGRKFIINADGSVVSPTIQPTEMNLKGLTINNGSKDTFKVDASGNVTMDVTSLKISGTSSATTTDVSNAVDALEIGGRNLLKGTSGEYKTFSMGQYYRTLYEGALAPLETYGLAVGDTITLSAYINAVGKDKGGRMRISLYKPDESYSTFLGTPVEAGTEGYSSVTITIDAGRDRIFFGINNTTAIVTPTDISYKWAKLEKGTKKTGWSQAPEDIDEQISLKVAKDGVVSSINQSAESVKISASKIDINGVLTVSNGEVAQGNIALGKTISGTGSNHQYLNDGVTTAGGNYVTFTGTGENASNNNTERGYVQYDLGQAYRIAESRVFFFSGDSRMYWYKIKYSTDGVTWHYAVGNSANNGWVTSPMSVGSSSVTYFPTVDKFPVPIVARYIRLYGNGNTINMANHAHEWELYCGSQTIIDGGSLKTGTVVADSIRGNLLQGVVIEQTGYDSESQFCTLARLSTNANGGILSIMNGEYGNLCASLGSESGAGPNRGGTLILYDNSSDFTMSRVRLGILNSNGGGILQLVDSSNNVKSGLDVGGFVGIGRRPASTWNGTIGYNSYVDLTHSLGYVPIVQLDGTGGNIIMNIDQLDTNTTRISTYNASWSGWVRFY
jgi:hypothetical protein